MISNFDSCNLNRREIRPMRHWRLALAMLVFISSIGGAPGHAADDVAAVSDTASLAKDAESEENKQCSWRRTK